MELRKMMKEFLTRGKKKVDIIKEVIWNSLIMFEILRLICLNLLHLIMLLILNVSILQILFQSFLLMTRLILCRFVSSLTTKVIKEASYSRHFKRNVTRYTKESNNVGRARIQQNLIPTSFSLSKEFWLTS